MVHAETGGQMNEALGGIGIDLKAEPGTAGAQQPKQAMEAQPSLQLVADATPDGEQLDLSSAEVDTVTTITTEKPEQAESGMKESKGGKPANAKKRQSEEQGQKNSQTADIGPEGKGKGDASDQREQSESEHSPGLPAEESAIEKSVSGTKGTGDRPAVEPEKPEAQPLPVTKQAEHQGQQRGVVSVDAQQKQSAGGETQQQEDRDREKLDPALVPGNVKQTPPNDALEQLKGAESVSAGKAQEAKPSDTVKAPAEKAPTNAGHAKSGTASPSQAHAEEEPSASKGAATPRTAELLAGTSAGAAPGSKAADAESAPKEAMVEGSGQEGALGKALFDPLGMDAPDEALAAAPEVMIPFGRAYNSLDTSIIWGSWWHALLQIFVH